MKYLKKFNESSKESIEEICKQYNITNYTINEDNSISVNGNVNLQSKGLTKLPLKFRDVSGYFNCNDNKLTSLEGGPKSVGGSFNCSFNKLTTLKGAPKSVSKDFYCYNNELITLEGAPTTVGDSFNCNNNQLKSLEGVPLSVGGHIYCQRNPISKYWKGEYKDYLELYLYLDIHTDDPDHINQQKIKFLEDEISKKI